jgi:dTDP-4-amino-4,6-dideoxygalactose transaminase
LADLPGFRPAPRAAWADPSFWLYTAALDADRAAIGRDAAIDALASRAIEARPIWTPLHRTRLYADAPRLGGAVADAIFASAFSLPSSSSLGQDDQARVIDVLRGAVQARSGASATRRSDG